jgi:hypothetical protein
MAGDAVILIMKFRCSTREARNALQLHGMLHSLHIIPGLDSARSNRCFT